MATVVGQRDVTITRMAGGCGAIVEGVDLVPPSFDPRGWLWTTETVSDGTITVAVTTPRSPRSDRRSSTTG